MRLTQKIVETVLYEGRSYMSKGGRKRWSRHLLWDDGLPGFGLRISSTNRKSFFVTYRVGGRKRTKTLGTADRLQLDEARQQAAELLESFDASLPSEATGRPQAEGVETVAQLADAYLENHLKGSAPSWFADQRLMKTHIKPAMGRSRLAEVTQADLANLGNRVARRFPADARRLKPLLKAMFDWAAEQGLWSKAPRRGRAAEAPPGDAPTAEPGPAADRDLEAGSEPPPAPPPSADELAEALDRSEVQRRELAARLEEVSSSGVEMLARIHAQTATQKETEAALRETRHELERALADAEGRPDPAKTGRQMHNLRQSVEQLMASVEEATGERDGMAAKLADAEARAAEQARKVTALARSRNKLEERLREEERKTAIRKVQQSSEADRRPLFMGLAAGAVAGILLTLLLQSALGGGEAPVAPRRGGPVAPAETADSDGAAGPAASGGGAAPEPAPSEPQAGARPTGGEPTAAATTDDDGPDFKTAEAAVRSWAAAWSAQRVDDYMAAYSPRFTPGGGLGRAEWAVQRRARILRPSSIRVTLNGLDVTVTGSDRARVTFEQAYETPTYADRVVKSLDLAWEAGGWKIVAERTG